MDEVVKEASDFISFRYSRQVYSDDRPLTKSTHQWAELARLYSSDNLLEPLKEAAPETFRDKLNMSTAKSMFASIKSKIEK
jgi:hypothetical protein